jgi:hypothetical protein
MRADAMGASVKRGRMAANAALRGNRLSRPESEFFFSNLH